METGLTKQRIIAELTRSPHGKLEQYLPIASRAAQEDGEFFAHLIAYNQAKGQIRDSKVALPVASLIPDYAFVENSLAHLALLEPRNLVKALRFAEQTAPIRRAATPGGSGHRRALTRVVESYLRAREAKPGWWDAAALQDRRSMKTLYALKRVKPNRRAQRILFKEDYPADSVFAAVAGLGKMSPAEAAATIMQKRIPFLVAVSALGAQAKDPDLVLALLGEMTSTEIVTNMRALEKMGVKDVPSLRGALELKLAELTRATKKQATFKTEKAAAAVSDTKLKAKLTAVQEKQAQDLGTVEGDWLVLGDMSASMKEAIETSKLVAATLAKMVKGKVRLAFFNTSPRVFDVTGKSYEEIKAVAQHVTAAGATSIGCGLMHALEDEFYPDGIAIVSDGAENSPPMFMPTYRQLNARADREVPVYLYWTKCHQPGGLHSNNDPEALGRNMTQGGYDLQVYDLRGGVDFYSLPNLVKTMRANRYSLIDEIMATPLLTLDGVFKQAELTA